MTHVLEGKMLWWETVKEFQVRSWKREKFTLENDSSGGNVYVREGKREGRRNVGRVTRKLR
jgi:hypothetical protein